MGDDNKQDVGEPSPASDGSVEPVAWAALRDDGDVAWIGYTPEGAADGAGDRRIVPLYAQSQPTLTDAEREAVERAAVWMMTLARDRREMQSAAYLADDAATLRALLERHANGGE